MTGYESKRAAARDKLDDDDTQVYQTELTKLLMESYDKGVADALEETKKALAQPAQEPWRESASDYERGVIDGRQMQAQSSVDKAVNRMAQPAQEPVTWAGVDFDINTTPSQRPWVGLTDAEKDGKRVLENGLLFNAAEVQAWELGVDYSEAKLKEKNT